MSTAVELWMAARWRRTLDWCISISSGLHLGFLACERLQIQEACVWGGRGKHNGSVILDSRGASDGTMPTSCHVCKHYICHLKVQTADKTWWLAGHTLVTDGHPTVTPPPFSLLGTNLTTDFKGTGVLGKKKSRNINNWLVSQATDSK